MFITCPKCKGKGHRTTTPTTFRETLIVKSKKIECSKCLGVGKVDAYQSAKASLVVFALTAFVMAIITTVVAIFLTPQATAPEVLIRLIQIVEIPIGVILSLILSDVISSMFCGLSLAETVTVFRYFRPKKTPIVNSFENLPTDNLEFQEGELVQTVNRHQANK